MPSGPPICALRASARRTSDSASIGAVGWATPVSNDSTGSTHCYGPKRQDGTRPHFLKLPGEAALAGWSTPDASVFEAKDLERLQARRAECKERTGNGNGFGLTLGQAAPLLTGWATPAARDFRHANAKPWSERGGGAKGEQLPNQVKHLPDLEGPARLTGDGLLLTGSDAGMSDGGQLSPHMSGWLMGFPRAWCEAAEGICLPRGRRSPTKTGKP